jgi:nucleoside-diphosphate-sugar epimerase
MSNKYRVLITGINGFIGQALSKAIRADGYDVWGIDIASDHDRQVIGVNLLDHDEVAEVYNKIPQCSVLIHTAALAHGQKPPKGETVITTNVKITDNLLEVFGKRTTHMIFLSSVAIYGEENRNNPVVVSDTLRPSTDYGKSKLICEEHVLDSDIKNYNILRLAPVYDQAHMLDIRKRVFLPGLPSIKMIIKPSPQYSLTSIDTVVKTVLSTLSKGPDGQKIYNISDPDTYSQQELTTWFPGKEIIFPVVITKLFYWLTYFLPKNYGYKIRCFYWKLFCSNVYEVNL